MIPGAYIHAWSAKASWPTSQQVEQDLVIIAPLLPAGIRFDDDDALVAFECIWNELIARIRGDAWQLSDKVVEDLRRGPYPRLLRGDELQGG